MVIVKEIETLENISSAARAIDHAIKSKTKLTVDRMASICGMMLLRKKSLVLYRDGRFHDIKIEQEGEWYFNLIPRLNTEMMLRLDKGFYKSISIYPPSLVATAINISAFYNEVKYELGYLRDLSLANPDILELFCLRDLQLTLAMIYNCIEDRHVVCHRGEFEGCRYSSVPVYDGHYWEELTLESETIKTLLSLQGIKNTKLTTRKLKVYINVPN